MKGLVPYDWLWIFFWLYFAVIEGIGLVHEAKHHTDDWTLTHVLSSVIPISVRAALLAWLAFHFLVEHKSS